MTDIYDRASEREEDMRRAALEQQERRGGLAGKTLKDSAKRCGVCNESIPIARRRAVPGVQTCIDCQTDLERALRHR